MTEVTTDAIAHLIGDIERAGRTVERVRVPENDYYEMLKRAIERYDEPVGPGVTVSEVKIVPDTKIARPIAEVSP